MDDRVDLVLGDGVVVGLLADVDDLDIGRQLGEQLAELAADERTPARTRAAEDRPVAEAAGGLPGRGAPPGAEA